MGYVNIKSNHKITNEQYGKLKAPLKAKYEKEVIAAAPKKPAPKEVK